MTSVATLNWRSPAAPAPRYRLSLLYAARVYATIEPLTRQEVERLAGEAHACGYRAMVVTVAANGCSRVS